MTRAIQAPVDEGHVDLADVAHAGVHDAQPRQDAELDGLLGDREGGRDERLRRDDGRGRGEQEQRDLGPGRCQQEEGVLHAVGVVQQHGALAEVVDDQRRHDDAVPGDADGPLAEVAEVGVQGLTARHDEDDGTQRDEGDPAVFQAEVQRVQRVDGGQHMRVVDDVGQAQRGEHHEPQQHDRPEGLADAAGAEALHGEQASDDDQRQRQDGVVQLGLVDVDALDGAQHRHGRRDDGVAEEDGGAEQPDQHQRAAQRRLVVHGVGGQRQHGDQAAFAVVVGAQDQQHVLDRDDDSQRPEQQGEHAQDVVGRRGDMAAVEDFFEGVQRAGADVAIDDPEGAEGQARQRRGAAGRVGRTHFTRTTGLGQVAFVRKWGFCARFWCFVQCSKTA